MGNPIPDIPALKTPIGTSCQSGILQRVVSKRDLTRMSSDQTQSGHTEALALTLDHDDDDAWHSFLAGSASGHHEQSSLYARLRSQWGLRSFRLVVRESGRLAGGAQFLLRPTPLGMFAAIQRGPLAIDGRNDILECVSVAVDQTARKRGWRSVRIDTFPTQNATRHALLNVGFCECDAWADVKQSLTIDLNQTDDTLLSAMTQKARYNVGLARRAGVTVKIAGAKEFHEFYRLHRQTAEYQGFPTLPEHYFQHVHDVFVASGKASMFIAYHDSRAIASILNTIVDRRMYYGWGGLDRDPTCRPLMANYLLHFSAMQWGREHGCELYDLCGTTEFKRKLGGESLTWPKPLRKFYGRTARLHRAAFDASWATPSLRSQVDRLARRLGYRRTLPY
jgi:lipid II:glycine glycyltransferase (peptidoglycan interpeptide bridge formation enzyme)